MYASGALSACQGGRNPLAGTSSLDERSATNDTLQAGLPKVDPLVHLLRRSRFGISASDYEQASALGIDGYLNQQLQPDSLSGRAELEADARFPATAGAYPGSFYAYESSKQEASQALTEKTIFLAAYSDRQLFEVMTDFWTNHFNIENVTGKLSLYKLYDDAEVIRKHALGNFRELLHASARSPAMLEYLDGVRNKAAGPNENYARELMELHTLGVDGGYSEDDIKEIARAFSGWTVNNSTKSFQFLAANHDSDEKFVLGHRLAAGRGIEDGNDVLDILLNHPATAKFLSRKLAQRFVSDTPPSSIVNAIAETYRNTDGDISSMLRTLFTHTDFYAYTDTKARRPLEFVCGTLRAFNAEPASYPGASVINLLSRLGQVPHRWFPPDGYPDFANYWINTSGLLERWNFAATTIEEPGFFGQVTAASFVDSKETPQSLVTKMIQQFLFRSLRGSDSNALIQAAARYGESLEGDDLENAAETVLALIIASPYFNLR
ncbi:MAG: DUF1800 domain-containing protein [Oceanococcus sp.]